MLYKPPTNTQQKARIMIAMYAMGKALKWFHPKFFREEPVLAWMLERINFCFARCEIWQALNNVYVDNKLSASVVDKAMKLYDKKYHFVRACKESKIGIYTSAFLEAASMNLNDCIKTCIDYPYRPMFWMYRCSQRVLVWMYDLFGEEEIYETGTNWYFEIMDKIGRK